MTMRSLTMPLLVAIAVLAASPAHGQRRHENLVIDLWTSGTAAFGVFVPDENTAPRSPGRKPVYTLAGGERLAAHPLYDFVFLNLEGSYDASAIAAIAKGLRSAKAVSRKTLIVRIPTIEQDGVEAARARVREAFALGADGVTIPHVQSVEQARVAIEFFKGVDVWSAVNPAGEKLAMLMIEDPGALEQAARFADLPGYSILACGIGSLTAALKGDKVAAEAGNQRILRETKRTKLVNMLTASPQDVQQRVKEGFLALLTQVPMADEVIGLGRKAAGR